MGKSYVIGLEGGGTFTRVMVADLEGNVVAYQESGSAHPNKDPNAKKHIQEAVLKALSGARIEQNQVVFFAAGIPGYEQKQDLEWANPLVDIEGLACLRLIMNDSEVGHAGAFLFEPGIMAISGTGSMIMGREEEGRVIFNSSIGHYAPTAARFLAYDAVYKILAGQVNRGDELLVKKVLDYWNVPNEQALRERALNRFIDDRMERDRRFGLMAPILTEAAFQGVPLARNVCDEAVRYLETGIKLIGGFFRGEQVKVCFVGSVIRSAYICNQLTEALEVSPHKAYQVVEPILSPVAGAVAIALRECGIHPNQEMVDRLLCHSKS